MCCTTSLRGGPPTAFWVCLNSVAASSVSRFSRSRSAGSRILRIFSSSVPVVASRQAGLWS